MHQCLINGEMGRRFRKTTWLFLLNLLISSTDQKRGWRLRESTYLFLLNPSMCSTDQKREIEDTAMGPIEERDILASPGR
jgi:hypothetical protein